MRGTTNERYKPMATAVQLGVPVAKVAKRFNVTPSVVCHALKAHGGIPKRDGLKPETIAKYKKIASVVREGVSVDRTCRRFSVSPPTVYAALKHEGVLAPGRSAHRKAEILSEIMSSIKGNRLTETFEELGEELGISKQRVHQVFNEAKECGLLKASVKPLGGE